MRKGLVLGLGAAMALVSISATDASACSRRVRPCAGYAPPVAYQYAPPPVGYGYAPPAPVYDAPPRAYYGPPAAAGYGYGPPGYGYGYGRSDYYGVADYGYRGRSCGSRGYGYAPPVSYDGYGYDGYRPAGVWVPVR